MHTRNGTLPKDANGLIAVSDDTGWAVYRRAASAEPWVSLKLVHVEPIEGAANYWLGWHTQEKRFGRTGDTARLGRDRPELLAWATDAMLNLYPTLTEEDMAM